MKMKMTAFQRQNGNIDYSLQFNVRTARQSCCFTQHLGRRDTIKAAECWQKTEKENMDLTSSMVQGRGVERGGGGRGERKPEQRTPPHLKKTRKHTYTYKTK